MSAYEEWGHAAVAASLGIATMTAMGLVGCAAQQQVRAPMLQQTIHPRTPVPGAPYTRDKEDELAPASVPLQGRWKALPPVEYDRPYTGRLTIARGDARTMIAVCPKTSFYPTLGCATHYTMGGKDYSCHVYIADDDILKPTGWTYRLILRHEIGHCLSWPANHPGMRVAEPKDF